MDAKVVKMKHVNNHIRVKIGSVFGGEILAQNVYKTIGFFRYSEGTKFPSIAFSGNFREQEGGMVIVFGVFGKVEPCDFIVVRVQGVDIRI